MKSKTPRQGFTLVELLVVIAIIGILIALLLPAVQQAREAARRMQCTNNMKQMALAMHNYHDAYERMPPFAVQDRNNRWSWAALILPYIEQAAVHEQLGVSKKLVSATIGNSSNTPEIEDLLVMPLDAYRCPSDTGEDKNPNFNNATTAYATSSYGMSLGVGRKSGGGIDGAFADVFDGLSNTFLIGEKALVEGDDSPLRSVGGIWLSRRKTSGSLGVTARHPPNSPYVGNWPCCGSDPQATRGNAVSMHPGGLNYAFCDGSVHFIAENIESSPVLNNTWKQKNKPLKNDFVYRKLYWANDEYVVGDF